MAADEENPNQEESTQIIESLELERDSLREELKSLRSSITALQEELRETKKINYTLARQIPSRKNETFDDAIVSMYGKRRT